MAKKATATAKPKAAKVAPVSKAVEVKAPPVAAPKEDKKVVSKLLDKKADGSQIIRSSVVGSKGFVTFTTAVGSGYKLSEAEYKAL